MGRCHWSCCLVAIGISSSIALRSTSAVVDYLFRVAGDESHDLGHELVRYVELAKADDASVEALDQLSARVLGRSDVLHPTLPTIQASNMDEAGATVYHLILEDIAETRFERDESDRLNVLSMLAGTRCAIVANSAGSS